MNWPHWIIVPIVLPLCAGALLVLCGRALPGLARALSLLATAALLLVALGLLARADGGAVDAYLLSNWRAPFGIALALDRLSALMLVLTALVGLASLLYATGGDDRRGAHFHALFQFQLMGLNGAFLTADLFNLFVFFEVLLIASYGLLLHGAGAARLKASIHYVSFNLTGSALFLIAVSLLYGLTGTLNMADLAQRVPLLGPDRGLLVHSAALLLLVVFCVKAALLPLNFWLPGTYGAASAPVAALFAIMTKVGVYAVLRTTTLIFGPDGGAAAMAASPWLEWLALATLGAGAVGALAARQLRGVVVSCIVVSAGTLLLGVALATPDSVAAALFYLVNSTLVGAAMFLLADRLDAGTGTRTALGVLFLVFAVATAGMPPLGGFLGKAWLVQAAGATPLAAWAIATILASALLVMVALARTGSHIFWKPGAGAGAPGGSSLPTNAATPPVAWQPAHGWSLAMLLVLLLACTAFAGPLSRTTQAASAQLLERKAYIDAVLGARPVPAAIDVRREMRERRATEGKP
jgi:multicomponent K+:H+ antiporter subunit D